MSDDGLFDESQFEGTRRNVILNNGLEQFRELVALGPPEEAWERLKGMDAESLRWIVLERLWTYKTMGGPIHDGDWEIDWPDVD